MRSSTKRGRPEAPPTRRTVDVFDVWNRKLHFYIGLFVLLFLWLFAFTGLLLNHPRWTFADFWPNRHQSSFERTIVAPPAGGDLVQATDIMRQTGVRGEIEWTRSRSDLNRLQFRVSRPGHILEIKADLQQNRVTVQQIDLNGWGIAHILHTFTGVRIGDKTNSRDWIMTTIWALSMDAVALGSILMVFSSIYMWWTQKRKRWMGLLALSMGTVICGLFVIGLRGLC